MRKFIFFITLTIFSGFIYSQDIPQHISYTRIYDFMDELANDGYFELNSSVKPYSRDFIAKKLLEATKKRKTMSKRQIKELYFFLNEYSLENDRLMSSRLPGLFFNVYRTKTSQLNIAPPVFNYKDDNFRARISPILGMNIYQNKKGQISHRWFGVSLQAMIGKHLSVYGSLRDNSFTSSSDTLSARLSNPTYLTRFAGYEYKEPNDFSDSRGGIKLSYDWGSIGLVKDNIVWGDNYNGSNIISGRVPSFPMITLNLKPASWFEMNFIHGWLVSNVVDSARFYVENGTKRHYRNHNKYISANMFTFKPIKNLYLSFGNSIIYAEDNVQPAYLLPIALYKSIDHTLTKGIGTENQNSQLFFNISSRNIKHLHLYSSVYLDELKFGRFKPSNKETNPISYKVGAKISNLFLKNYSLTAEYTKTNIINYKHSIAPLTFASNSYNLGHYLGDNSKELFLELKVKPIRGLDLSLTYLNAQHGNEYEFIRRKGRNNIIRQIIKQPSLGDVIWKNQTIGFKALYEIFQNTYAIVNIENSNIQGFEATSKAIDGEKRMTANEVLEYYTPQLYRGKNTTFTVGLSFGF